MRISSSMVMGWVSTSMPRTNRVPNSGMPKRAGAGTPICFRGHAQRLGPWNSEQDLAKYLRIVQRHLLRRDAGQVLQLAQHGGIIVSQDVQLYQHVVHGAESRSAW